MDIYDSDNFDRDLYDSKEQQHYHESLDWSDNVFGESLPGQGDEPAAGDDGMADDTADDGDVSDVEPADDAADGVSDEDAADEDSEDAEA